MNGSTIIRTVAGKHHVQDLIRIIRHFVFIENSVVAALEQHDRQKEQYAFHDEKIKVHSNVDYSAGICKIQRIFFVSLHYYE